MSRKFLEQIADYYTHPSRIKNLSDITFIFPNKRSATFLKNFIEKRITDDYALLPRFTTFQNFAAYTSDMPEPVRYELLFMLYNAYVDAIRRKSPEAAEDIRFDRFIFWGDMILDDFNTIDSSFADARKLYSNLKGLKEISSDYLTDEQKEIIERIWGSTSFTQHVDSFWLHLSHGDKDEMTRKFINLWEVLGDVYESFHGALKKKGFATKGFQLRRAAEIIRDTPVDELAGRKFVFVGLAELSYAEIDIMERLKQAGAAEFFWDLASPYFYKDGKLDKSNPAIRFIARMAEVFPMPFALDAVAEPGAVEIIGCPSSVIQTKIAGNIIRDMGLDERSSLETAVVVPDLSQLMPLMLSLPKLPFGVNLTLGLPYTATTFATLFGAIINMQHNSRKPAGRPRAYFYKDVLEILLHPHLQMIAGKEANLLRQHIHENRLFTVGADFLLAHFPSLAFIFRPINDAGGEDYLNDIESASQYVENLIDTFRERLAAIPGFNTSFEKENLKYFSRQIVKLKELIVEYVIDMKESTFLVIFERIMNATTVNMEGTPLQGLQIMGVLETRCLDFDNIIFMAMNEQSLPRREYVRTMIPNSLRRGYGLPTIEHTESFYFYYFFRAIGRASRATLLYDTRQPGRNRSERSRYIEQLLYVFRGPKVTHNTVQLTGTIPPRRVIEVEKDAEVMKRLNRLKEPGSGFRLSASALKKYLECPLHFYLEYVVGIRDENEFTDYIDSADLGDILHKSLQRIYERFKGRTVTADDLEGIKTGGELERIVTSEIARVSGLDPDTAVKDDLNSEGTVIHGHIVSQISVLLDAERAEINRGNPFRYVAGELDIFEPQWKIGDHSINFRLQIDRIDSHAPGELTFIDYKTGVDKTNAGNELSELFDPENYDRRAVFQLLVYAAAYTDLATEAAREGKAYKWLADAGVPTDIRLKLYTMRDLMSKGSFQPIKFKGEPLPPFSAISSEFRPLLANLINEIFDEGVPFRQCDTENNCKFCHFLSVCGRNLPPENKF